MGKANPLYRFSALIVRMALDNSGRGLYKADGAEPASAVSFDEFRRAYHAEVAKWEKFVRDTKVKL